MHHATTNKKIYLAIIKDSQILLTQDLEGDTGWKLPGGHLEGNETFEQAGIREIKEELGLDIKIGEQFLQEEYYKIKKPDILNIKTFYYAHIVSGEIQINLTEVKEAKWFSFAELKSLDKEGVYPSHLSAIKYLKTVL